MLEIFEKQIPKKFKKKFLNIFAFPREIIINKDLIGHFVIEKNLINKKFFKKKTSELS